jgi:formate dehydrogenase major subunit
MAIAATTRRELLRLTGIGSVGIAASQLAGLGFNVAFAKESAARRKLEGTTQTASICPYCAVGCGTMVASKKDDRTGLTRIVNIEGNPDSPISTGSLCPKGAATFQLAVNDLRVTKVMRRKPNATDWDKEEIAYDAALDRIAELVQKTRQETFVERDPTTGKLINQTTGIFALGGATNDNEENYLICKVMRMVGVVRIENQARI